jgi:hypothetical protein
MIDDINLINTDPMELCPNTGAEGESADSRNSTTAGLAAYRIQRQNSLPTGHASMPDVRSPLLDNAAPTPPATRGSGNAAQVVQPAAFGRNSLMDRFAARNAQKTALESKIFAGQGGSSNDLV